MVKPMTRAMQTVNMTLEKRLLERLQNRADSLGLNAQDLIHRAIKNELLRLDQERVSDTRISHLQSGILAQPQSMLLPMEDEEEDLSTCEICLKSIPGARKPVEGPLLCNSCMSLARR